MVSPTGKSTTEHFVMVSPTGESTTEHGKALFFVIPVCQDIKTAFPFVFCLLNRNFAAKEDVMPTIFIFSDLDLCSIPTTIRQFIFMY